MKRLLLLLIISIPMLKLSAQSSPLVYNVESDQLAIFQESRKEMSKEEEEKFLSKLSKDMKAKLEEIKKLNKDKYQQMLRSSSQAIVFSSGYSKAEGVFGLTGFSESYKKEKELEVDVEYYALKCKTGDENSQSKMKQELKTKLSELFDLKEEGKQRELKQLEKRIQELKESLQARKDNKQEIINRRIQELLGDVKYLRWE